MVKRAPIIYYGGKTTMLPIIKPLIPKHEVYNEPYFGGGAVFWAKEPAKNETINDRLDIVVNFYQVLKKKYQLLKTEIDASLYSRTLYDRALLIIRNAALFDDVQKAWAFWYCSNFSFLNKLGCGLKYSNDLSITPAGLLANGKTNFTDELVKRLEGVMIENRCALQVTESRNVANAWHFIDPPYPGADQGQYKGYTWADLEAQLKQCETLKGKFMLTNYPSDLLTEYVKRNNWNMEAHTISNAGVRKNGRTKKEVVVYNYPKPSVQQTIDF